jgi:hypothetical protein
MNIMGNKKGLVLAIALCMIGVVFGLVILYYLPYH